MRRWQFAACLLLAIVGIQALEIRATQRDWRGFGEVYDKFLSKKAGGKPMVDQIRPETLALFKAKEGLVACAMFKGVK